MQPEQHNASNPQPPVNSNPYDFILNAEHKPKKQIPLPTGNSMLQRVLIVVGLMTLLIIIFVVAFSFIGANSKKAASDMSKLAGRQTELIRISNEIITRGKATDVRNKASTIKAFLSADKISTSSFASKNGANKNQLTIDSGAFKDKSSDNELSDAEKNGEFDQVATDLLDSLLKGYLSELSALYKQSSSSAQKEILQKSYDSAELLLSKS